MIEIESPDHAITQEIEPILNATQLTYDEFFRECLVKNRICVFNSELTEKWESRQKWVSNGAPNLQYLLNQYGSCEGPVANCQRFYLNRQTRRTMCINDYIKYWMKFKENNNDDVLYLKDWHCVKQSRNSSFYQVPQYFASDWLNEYCISKNLDDYMFVYMGPKGSWTPFHVDVLTSYSWSANVCGRKKWLFFPPGQESYFLNNRGLIVRDVTSDVERDINNFTNQNEEAVQSFEIIQEPGQVVFVPFGWYHQVWNLEDAISINHNWINGCNIFQVWSCLKKDLTIAITEIKDCREMNNWKEHCQLMLKASFGLDYKDLIDILEFIAEKRLKALLGNSTIINFNKWVQGRNHNIFDLKQIQAVLNDYIKEVEEKSLSDICPLAKVHDLSSRIAATI